MVRETEGWYFVWECSAAASSRLESCVDMFSDAHLGSHQPVDEIAQVVWQSCMLGHLGFSHRIQRQRCGAPKKERFRREQLKTNRAE